MIIHFDEVKDKAIGALQGYRDKPYKLFINRDVFGRISVYIYAKDNHISDDILPEIRNLLTEVLGSDWVDKVEIVEENSFILHHLEDSAILIEKHTNLYFSERHLTRLNWFNTKKLDSKDQYTRNNKTQIVTFYSFKGGLGRTTSLVLTALQLVRMGKKVILVDFDLEAPGLATLLLPENGEYPKYGVIDYLLESHIYIKSDNQPDIDEYLYTVYDSVLTGTNGGQLYVLPAAKMNATGVENYLEKISRIDFGTPQYLQNDNSINRMLFQITEQFSPDFIFLDARTGINDVGGLTLTRLSNIGVLLFYGTEQNIMGMDIVLPKVIKSGIPFFLINSPVPLSEGDSREEEEWFLENAYRIFVASGAYDENALPDLYEKSADHYPFTVEYNPNAVLLNTTSKIINLLAYGGKENVYRKLAEEISAYASKDNAAIIKPKHNKRGEVLAAISSISDITPAAENEFKTIEDLKNNFFPLKEHRFIFEQDKFLILGSKGSGKTALFSVLQHRDYALELANFSGVSAKQIQGTYWVTGLKEGYEFPSKPNFDAVGEENNDIFYQRYWRGLAVRALQGLLTELQFAVPNDIKTVLTVPFSELRQIMADASLSEKIEEFLYSIDKYLESKKENIIITYDALDRLLDKSYRGRVIAALISLWFDYLSRFKRIRVKIFLRNDIFKHEVKEGITDKVKLRNYSANLVWDYDHLLAMLWKRMLHRSEEIVKLFENALKSVELGLIRYKNLGFVPKADEAGNKAILQVIMGEKMGQGRKAYSYNWIKYHLSDTNNNIVPRSILALFVLATIKEKEQPEKEASNVLIKPRKFESVMPEVSSGRVMDLTEEYNEFLNIFENLKNHLKNFPAGEEDLKDALRKCGVIAGEEETVIDQLKDIGVFKPYQKKKSDPVRYHIPDIYLFGMGLVRKGPG